MATTYYDAINDGETILSNTLDIGETTSFVVNDGSQLPVGGAGTSGFIIKLEDTLGNAEYIECTHRSGNTVYISNRGFEGTFARTWIAGSYLKNVFTKSTKDEITDKILVVSDESITASTNVKTIEDKSGTIVLPRTKSEYVSYDNATSGLVATDVQAAVDELVSVKIGDLTYTEQNYVTNGEPLTDSIDSLDVGIASHLAESASKHITASGSNANGKYIKFDNGTMICTRVVSNSEASSTRDLGVLNFAQSFYEIPVVQVTKNEQSTQNWSGIVHVGQISATGVRVVMVSATSGTAYNFNITAIGRWKA